MILSDNAPGTPSGEAMRAAAANSAAAAASAAASPSARAQVVASQEAAKAQAAAAARFAPAPTAVTSTFNTKMALAIGGLVAAAGVVGYFVLRKTPRAALAGLGELPDADRRALEALLDRGGNTVRDIVEGLAEISDEKAEHIRVNWQDEPMARGWEKMAKRLQRCSTQLKTV